MFVWSASPIQNLRPIVFCGRSEFFPKVIDRLIEFTQGIV